MKNLKFMVILKDVTSFSHAQRFPNRNDSTAGEMKRVAVNAEKFRLPSFL